MDGILINGFPKSGNHALQKACALLGVPVPLGHTPYAEKKDGKYILIIRDPRDILISMVTFRGKPLTLENLKTEYDRWEGNEGTLAEKLAEYEGWLDDPDTVYLKYEELIANDETMRELADFLGVPYPEGTFEKLEGLEKDPDGFTFYSFPHSDHTKAEGIDGIVSKQLLATWHY